MTIETVLVAAVARNGVIGGGNALVWRLPSDLRHFKALTLGNPVIMGRKTFQSIGRILPGRANIVVTRDPMVAVEGGSVVADLASALDLGHRLARDSGAGTVCVIGGGEIYAQAMAQADRLEITEVALDPAGDVVFPVIDPDVWVETARVPGVRGPADEADFAFVTYRRRESAQWSSP